MWKHLIFFIVITIMLVGCNVNSSNNISDVLTIQKAEKSVESYIRNNYENVKTVEFNDDYSHPMGGMMIRGIVNNAGFSADIDLENFQVVSLGEKTGFQRGKKNVKRKVVTIN